MADKSLITQEQLQSDLEQFYSQKVYPYLNGSANLGFTPIGTVISVMSNEAPDNYLVCDGTAYNISEYSDLANFFEDQFGSKNYFGGNGTTTFAVPDLRGEFLRGTGTNTHTNQGSGANIGVHQDATEFPRVSYNVNTSNNSIYLIPANPPTNMAEGSITNYDSSIKSSTALNKAYSSKLPDGDTWATSTDNIVMARPTNTSVLYCIAYKNIYFQQMHDYSTTEHVVGTWIDGKPLYEKILKYDAVISSSTNILINVSNIDFITKLEGYGYYISVENIRTYLPLPYYHSNSDFAIQIYYNNEKIIVVPGSRQTSVGNWLFTIQYTKTTDTV